MHAPGGGAFLPGEGFRRQQIPMVDMFSGRANSTSTAPGPDQTAVP